MTQGDVLGGRVRVHYLRDAHMLYGEGLAYATPGSVGLDLRACPAADEGAAAIVIAPGSRVALGTGIAVEPLPEPGQAMAGFVYSRSGLGAMQGLTVAQGVGVIDPDYRGEITVVLLNTAGETRTIQRGERIAQLVFQPVCRVALEPVTTLGTTQRGAGGFGHTGHS